MLKLSDYEFIMIYDWLVRFIARIFRKFLDFIKENTNLSKLICLNFVLLN